MSKYNQGRFVPKNRSKYKGNPTNIVYRSSWEKQFFIFVDNNPAILRWSSEEKVIPYLYTVDNSVHRYFVDIDMDVRQKDGNIKNFLVEIKPLTEIYPPKQQKRTKSYINKVLTYEKNCCKWRAAIQHAEHIGSEFIIFYKEGEFFKPIYHDQIKKILNMV